jgi:uncharacterized protein YfaS (alpha-2-macroglobulin family)
MIAKSAVSAWQGNPSEQNQGAQDMATVSQASLTWTSTRAQSSCAESAACSSTMQALGLAHPLPEAMQKGLSRTHHQHGLTNRAACSHLVAAQRHHGTCVLQKSTEGEVHTQW